MEISERILKLIETLNERIVDNSKLNKRMCKRCNGDCCKNKPCAFHPSQFSGLSINNSIEDNTYIVITILSTMIVSVDSCDYIQNGVNKLRKCYYLRMRGYGCPILDNITKRCQCVVFGYSGCMLPDTFRPYTGYEYICTPDNSNDNVLSQKLNDEIVRAWDVIPIDWEAVCSYIATVDSNSNTLKLVKNSLVKRILLKIQLFI